MDLHSHTYYSDGELSPGALVNLAKQQGIKTLALTDHDTVLGIPEALQSAKENNLELIPGVELSASWQRLGIHVVGLDIDTECSVLLEGLSLLQAIRLKRAHAIADLLKGVGILSAFEGASALAKNNNISRTHYARFLIQKGIVRDQAHAFKRYLGRSKSAYVSAEWPSLSQVITWIHQAKGLAVLAHPTRYSLTASKLLTMIRDFKEAGGDAIEVVTARTQSDELQWLRKVCNDFELFASVGSDYHGPTTWANIGKLKPLPLGCQPIWEHWRVNLT